MAKVKDDAPPARSTKSAAAPSALRDAGRQLVPLVSNFVKADLYKPAQGWYARLWTAVGVGLLFGAGLFRYYQTQLEGQASTPVRLGLPTAIGVALAWITFRIVQYPPFVDFLIATEAEMNKVSWTSRDELRRATIVVIVTVLLMSLYLFGVDFLWSALLQRIGILRFTSEGFGSQAG
jgi:preprotein translocase subunit SecE